MRNVASFVMAICFVVALALAWYHHDIEKSLNDFQAYQSKSLLPEDLK